MRSATILEEKLLLKTVIANQDDVYETNLSKETIFWIMRRNDCFSLYWLSATEYCPSCIRLRNDLAFTIPKGFWRFPEPQRSRSQFQLTFHQSEITKDIATRMFEFSVCSEKYEKWPLFDDNSSYPSYAWTKLADQHYNKIRGHRGKSRPA